MKIEQFKRQSAQKRNEEEEDKMLSTTPDPGLEWFLINPPPEKIKQHDIPWRSDNFGDVKFIDPKGRKKRR